MIHINAICGGKIEKNILFGLILSIYYETPTFCLVYNRIVGKVISGGNLKFCLTTFYMYISIPFR